VIGQERRLLDYLKGESEEMKPEEGSTQFSRMKGIGKCVT
jgi:hypothetical protein